MLISSVLSLHQFCQRGFLLFLPVGSPRYPYGGYVYRPERWICSPIGIHYWYCWSCYFSLYSNGPLSSTGWRAGFLTGAIGASFHVPNVCGGMTFSGTKRSSRPVISKQSGCRCCGESGLPSVLFQRVEQVGFVLVAASGIS